MYDIKQFRPMLYVLILLGISGFTLAMESPGLWIISTTLILINAWLVITGQFKPAPRILINLILLLAVGYALLGGLHYYFTRAGVPILIVGQFLVIQQIARFWIQKTNSDYAQLLVLNLLLMVAAAISTASLAFGILLIVYLFLSLYCCLLFHLKVETDDAKAAMALPEHRINPNTLKQDQRYLLRSMRRLTGLVSVFAIGSAVIAFLFVPRFAAPGRLLSNFQWKPQDALSGFSEHIDFQQVTNMAQSSDPVATVKVWEDDKLALGTQTLLLRGVALDNYNGSEWTRTGIPSLDQQEDLEPKESWTPQNVTGFAHYKQSIQLSPTQSPVLFAIAGPVTIVPQHFGPARLLTLKYSPADESIVAATTLQRPVEYDVYSTGVLNNQPPNPNPSPDEHSHIDPMVVQYARQSSVIGDLYPRRQAIIAARPIEQQTDPTELDGQIAGAIEQDLRKNFSYTLNVGDAGDLKGRDPVVAFLYDWKRGHCEYFAGAMTLLCQSLGMDARMVIGFRCANFNRYGHYYNVTQSDAHAWVEVRTPGGWKTFDPTSGHDADIKQATLWQRTKSFFDFLEYTWANAVIAYGPDNRQDLISNVQTKLTATAASIRLATIARFVDTIAGWLATRVVFPIIVILGTGIFATIAYYFLERRKLRRRASQIGIDSLPPSAQQRLVRQLLFYSELLRLLERHQITRPQHLTPMEFSYSLSYLPIEAYDTIRRLTRLFYRIRYGHSQLDAGRHRRLANVIFRLETSMSNTRTIR